MNASHTDHLSKYHPTSPHAKAKLAANVVRNSVGTRNRSATPTTKKVKKMATRMLARRAVMSEKMKMDAVKRMKRRRGMP